MHQPTSQEAHCIQRNGQEFATPIEQMEPTLQGQDGRRIHQRAARHRADGPPDVEQPESGRDQQIQRHQPRRGQDVGDRPQHTAEVYRREDPRMGAGSGSLNWARS